MTMKPSGHYSITIVTIALVTWTAVLGAAAQKTSEKSAIVTGRVTFAETQLPARLAEVVLVREPESASDLVPDETSASAPEPHKNEPELPDRVVSISGRSGVDGSYTIADVPPGDYFVVAKMPGYVVPIATPSSRAEARDIARLTRDLPKVHLEANHTASVDLMLHHGAVISGQVRFRDGSPSIGVPVSAKTAGKGEDLRVAYQPLLMAMQTDLRSGLLMGQYEAVTDDQGRYRLCGLPPGSYVVSTTLTVGGGMRMVQQGQHGFGGSQAGAPDVTLKVYQPSGFHESRAKVFELHANDAALDADIQVDLDNLRTVRGRVLRADHHPVGQAEVLLTDQEAPVGANAARYAQVQEDGTFVLNDVAAGSYTLIVLSDLDESPPQDDAGERRPARAYRSTRIPVAIDDHDVDMGDLLFGQRAAAPDTPAGFEN